MAEIEREIGQLFSATHDVEVSNRASPRTVIGDPQSGEEMYGRQPAHAVLAGGNVRAGLSIAGADGLLR